MGVKYIRKNKRWFIQNKEITTQYLAEGKTKKEANADYEDSLKKIFSNPKERKLYSLKSSKKSKLRKVM